MTTEIRRERPVAGPGAGDDPVDRPDTDERTTRGSRVDLAVVGAFILLAFMVLVRLWRDTGGRYLSASVADQHGYEWTIAVVTHAVTQGENPLFTDAINAPHGVNIMAQTSVLGLIVPMIPVTLLFGPEITFAMMLTLALAGTAVAWYWLFSRHLVESRWVAAVGAGLVGFAPAAISHAAGGHVNYVAQFLLPLIVWWTLRLREPGRWLRNGAVLGVLVAYQIFIGEEPLLLCALGLVVFIAAYAANRREVVAGAWRPFLAGGAVAVAVATLLAGYPLWWQLNGEQSYDGIPHAVRLGNDVFSLTTFASQSLGGGKPVGTFAYNATEENGFFGWPLLILTLAAAVWLWRTSVLARAAAITGAVFLFTSLGTEVLVDGRHTGIPGPWRVLAEVPLVGWVLPSRLTFVTTPAIAVLVMLALQRLLALIAEAKTAPGEGAAAAAVRVLRLLSYAALAAALVPLLPTPVQVLGRPDPPAFFSTGAWRDHVPAGGVILAVPPPDGRIIAPTRWQTAADFGFRHVEGYFIGPHGRDRHGWYGAERRPTVDLLNKVYDSGVVPAITDEQRRTARADLAYWEVDAVVLAERTHNANALRDTVDALLERPATQTAGVWVWDVP